VLRAHSTAWLLIVALTQRPDEVRPRSGTRDARITYRCCLRGPDGIRALAPGGSWGEVISYQTESGR